MVSQGKIETAISILKKFERVNGTNVNPELYQDFAASCAQLQQEEIANKNYSIFDLFRTPRLRRITITLVVIYMSISLVFDGHVRNVGQLGLNIFTTFTVASITELPANILVALALDRLGRRWYACGAMILSGVFSLLATAVPMGLYSAILAIVGRFFVNMAYSIGMQYAAELLPTVVRAQGVAFIHLMGYVATIIAPFIVYLGNISLDIPLILLGLIGIAGGSLCLFLPETMDKTLPQTLNDGEAFGSDQRFWSIPCLERWVCVDRFLCRSVNR